MSTRERLRVVTWNVGRLYSSRRNNRLDDLDVPEVARTLAELDSDVVMLQELVDVRQLEALSTHLGAYEGELAQRCGYDRHVALLVRRTFEPRFEHDYLHPTPRGMVLGRFRVGGLQAAAMAVHLDVFAARRRRQQAERVAEVAATRPEELVLVGGDFNYDPEWAERMHSLDAGTYRMLTRELDDLGREAGGTLLGVWRIDHLFARGGGQSVARVCTRRRLPLGDHHPLVCDLTLLG